MQYIQLLFVALSLVAVGLPLPVRADDEAMARGQAAFERGDMVNAVEAFEAARQSFDRQLGPDDPKTLRAQHELARAYDSAGRSRVALELIEQVVERSTRLLGERHPATLSSLNVKGTMLGRVGRDAERLAVMQKVLAGRTEVLGPRDPLTIASMNNLSTAYLAVGQAHLAEPLAREVIRLRSEVLGERHPTTLLAMRNRSVMLGQLGRHAEQLQVAEKALALTLEVHGERHAFTLDALNNLALAYYQLGRFAEAVPLAQRVAEGRKALKGERHPDALFALANLAATHGQAGQLAEQQAGLEALRAPAAEVFGADHAVTLTVLHNLAGTYGLTSRLDDQLALNLDVLARRTRALGERHPDTLVSVVEVALSHLAQGRPDVAVGWLERALALNVEVRGQNHPLTLATRFELARAHLAAGRVEPAMKQAVPYVDGAERQRAQPGLAADSRRAVFAQYARGYRLFAALQARQGLGADAFRLTELGKARTLLEDLASQRADRGGALPAAEQTRLDDLQRQVAAADQRLAQLSPGDARTALELRRSALEREFESLRQQLAARYPRYAQLLDVRLLVQADLPGLLPPGAMAISYLVSGDDLLAFLVDDRGRLQVRDLGAVPQLAELIELSRRALAWRGGLADVLAAQGRRLHWHPDGSLRPVPLAAPSPTAREPVRELGAVLSYLSERLLQPLRADLEGRTRWVISPDGPLAQLPFEVLPWGPAGAAAVAGVEVQYTPSLSVLAQTRQTQQRNARVEGRREVFAMGDARYSGQPGGMVVPGTTRSPSAPPVETAQLRELDQVWQNLPGTAVEVRAVAALFGDSATAYLGEKATEAQLLQLQETGELRRYRYLLFATHGYVSSAQPALSSVVLGLQGRAPGTDGYVTAAEWPGYELQSDLVVLSACDTGVGPVLAGEGVMGLPFALFVAGSANMILTLWPVDDQATARFVQRLFEGLRSGRSAAQALADTKREFARDRRYADPRYWAPFILVGAG